MILIITMYVSYLYVMGAIFSMIYFQPQKERIAPALIVRMLALWWLILPLSLYTSWQHKQ